MHCEYAKSYVQSAVQLLYNKPPYIIIIVFICQRIVDIFFLKVLKCLVVT